MGLFSGISDVLFGSNDMGDTRALLEQNKRLYQDLNLPEYMDYAPEAYAPESMTAEIIGEDPSLRSNQMAALAKMSGLAEDGLSAEDLAAFSQAKDQANQIANRGRAAAMQEAQARGVGGSGLEFMMREAALQDASEKARKSGVEQAATSARDRALANDMYMNALGSLRNQDLGVSQANTNILNQFNQENTQARNQAQQYNVDNRNQAQQYNNQLKQNQFNNQMAKIGGITGQNQSIGNTYAAENSARNANDNALLGAAIGGGMMMAGGGFGKAAAPAAAMAGNSYKNYGSVA